MYALSYMTSLEFIDRPNVQKENFSLASSAFFSVSTEMLETTGS
jgi:hypothetical protein